MSCPYVIRETIDADHIREHGYYQLDEMVYDLTHDFASADVEIVARPAYNVVMEGGERLSNVNDDTVFKMLSAGMPVKYVENARDGYIMYTRPENKPVVNADTKEILLGQLLWCMLSVEEHQRKIKLCERAFIRKCESEYKKAYLADKLYANSYSAKKLAYAEKACIKYGLTDIILTLAKEQCDHHFKLYNRGLISEKELLDVDELKSVIPAV